MLRKVILFLAKEISLCLVSAALLILSFPCADIWIFAWIGFVPLFFALRNKSKKQAFLLGYITGIIFWSGIIYWLVHVTIPGTIILILYLALYFGIFSSIVPPSTFHLPLFALFIPSIWVLLEYIRSYLFTGFPWALLGYSQFKNLAVVQIADITGAWGVSFLVMMVNVAIYSVLGTSTSLSADDERSRTIGTSTSLSADGERSRTIGFRFAVLGNLKKYLIPALLLVTALIYGYYNLYLRHNSEHQTPIKVSVIQGNIPQELKWHAGSRKYILSQYIRLTEEAAGEGPDLIIWPEASSPGMLGEDDWIFEKIFSLQNDIKIPLLLGTVTSDKEKYFNSAILIKKGKITERYDKLHLVPFGEYIPLKKFLPFLETVVPIGDINKGSEYTLFNTQYSIHDTQYKFAVLICFEDLFPELSRDFVKKGAQFLVNITNDAWYKHTSAPYQHLQASVFRAVENRTYLVRCANTGISGFINSKGKIVSLLKDKSGEEIFIAGYNTQTIPISERDITFYNRYSDLFIVLCFLFAAGSIMPAFKRKR